VISIGTVPCSEDECAAALGYKGYESSQISDALENFSGNIGMCIQYLEDSNLQAVAALTKKAADSIINKDEYSLLTVMSSAELKDRQSAITFLEMLDRVIRDATAIKLGGNPKLIGCYKKGAALLSERISVKSARKMHEYLNSAASDVKANVSPVLLMSALCGEIMNS
jgi:DNA polymerase-3 subunit delta'